MYKQHLIDDHEKQQLKEKVIIEQVEIFQYLEQYEQKKDDELLTQQLISLVRQKDLAELFGLNIRKTLYHDNSEYEFPGKILLTQYNSFYPNLEFLFIQYNDLLNPALNQDSQKTFYHLNSENDQLSIFSQIFICFDQIAYQEKFYVTNYLKILKSILVVKIFIDIIQKKRKIYLR